MINNQQICTFLLGQQWYGLDVLRVQEIIRHQPTTPVPLAHRVVRGLINLRGQIVTSIDLRRRLGLEDLPPEHESVNVVVQTDDGAISLLVDEIGDVLETNERDFERPPESLRGPARELIQSAYKLPGYLILILDPGATTELPAGAQERP